MNSMKSFQALSRHTPTTLTLQPPNFLGGRGQTISQTNILLITTRTNSPSGIPRRAYPEWFHPPHQISMGISSSFCKEKGWEPPPMCQFLHAQQSHREGSLSASPHHGPTQCSWSCQDIFENRFETCIPPHMHCGGGRT